MEKVQGPSNSERIHDLDSLQVGVLNKPLKLLSATIPDRIPVTFNVILYTVQTTWLINPRTVRTLKYTNKSMA
jgi:hypothetical protein